MPIGGVKEKILAAKRNNISYIILPHKNKHELTGLEELTKGMQIMWVKRADEVLNFILQDPIENTININVQPAN